MINGESYKWIVAEAAKKAMGTENIQEHVFIVRLINDKNDPRRVAGAAGFSVREHKLYIYKFKACLLACGGAVNVFRPRSVGEGIGRAWYPVWNAGSTYAMAAEAGAELTLMENRFVPARFKDGYGPVGAWFLLFKAKAQNAAGEDYLEKNYEELARAGYDKYAVGSKMGTCLRNHLMMKELREGRGPIFMDTPTAMAKLAETMTPKEIKHLEAEAWEDFLDMTIGQCGVWAGENIEPDKEMSELMPTEPYLLGSHAGCAGIWCSGPADIPGTPDHYHWGYNRMTTVKGLFTAGDGVGASGHKFSSGSHTEGRIAAKSHGHVRPGQQGLETGTVAYRGRTGRRDLRTRCGTSSSTRTTPPRSTSTRTTSRPRCCSSVCRRSWTSTWPVCRPCTRPTPPCWVSPSANWR